MAPDYKELHALVQKQFDHTLKLIKTTAELTVKMDAVEKAQDGLSARIDTLADKMPKKMEPNRCGHMHNELEQRIFARIRKGAQGWLYTTMVVLKIVVLLAGIFALTGWGANEVGLLN
jgi:hypothetical protein